MTITANDFTSNSLSGSIIVNNGFANVELQTLPWAFRGDENFQIKLRRESISGAVVAQTSVITINDDATVETFVPSSNILGEGYPVTFQLNTSNVSDGSTLYYTLEYLTANVFDSDFLTANADSFPVYNNQANIVVTANLDITPYAEVHEFFRVNIRANSITGPIIATSSNVEILDLANVRTYFVSSDLYNVLEPSNAILTVNTINVSNGTVLYYTTTGNANVNHFVTGNTGSFIVNDNTGTIEITTQNIPNRETVDFIFLIREDSISGNIVANSEVFTIYDEDLQYISATGGSITTYNSGGIDYTVHTFTTSGSFEVSGLQYPVTTLNNTVDYLIVAGGGGGGGRGGGGGGAGGMITSSFTVGEPGTYTVVRGGGGAGGSGEDIKGTDGGLSSISHPSISISADGGGGGGTWQPSTQGKVGGSGGGGGKDLNNPVGAPGTSGQGNRGGGCNTGTGGGAGGGGGKGGVGGTGFAPERGGAGGSGANNSLRTGSNITYAGGGGGGVNANYPQAGAGGAGGGGHGAGNNVNGVAGTNGLGGGGGGAALFTYTAGRAGGSGVVVLRYRSKPT